MKVKLLDEIVNYAYVGIFPNSIAAFSTYNAIECAADGNWGGFAGNAFAAGLSYLIGFGKFQEYRKIKGILEERGWDERIVKPKMYSWCKRHSARQAAKQLGYLEKFDEFSKSEGHKWYHLLPKVHKI